MNINIKTSIKNLASYLLLGVTATPSRSDNKGIDQVFDKVTFNFGIVEGIQKNWLARIRAFRIDTTTDLSKVKKTAGDFNLGELGDAVNTEDRNKLIVKGYKDVVPNEQALVFAVDVAHTEALAQAFTEEGISTSYIIGTTDKEVRAQRLVDFAEKKYQVMVNCMTLTEGYDNESIQTILMARPTQSGILNCLDIKTEILTPNGWKKYNEIKVSDKVYGFNLRNNSIIPTIVTQKIVRDLQLDECFYSIQTNAVDIRVTNKHRMIYDNERRLGWKIMEIEKLATLSRGFYFPCAGYMSKAGIPLSDAELQFIGWYLTDGSWNRKTNVISVSQGEHQPQIKLLERTLQDCNFGYRKYLSYRKTQFNQTSKNVTFVVPFGNPRKDNKTLRNMKHLKKKGWKHLLRYLGKEISDSLFEMTAEQFDVFIEAIHLGDGQKQLGQTWTRRSYHISTGNLMFADRLQHLALLHGYRANIKANFYKGMKNPIYVVHLKKQIYRCIGGQRETDRESFKKELHKTEKIWSIENSLGTIITRRNGKVVIVSLNQIL